MKLKNSLDKNNKIKIVSLDDATKLDLLTFNKIIIGASIRYGKHSKKLYKFITLNQNDYYCSISCLVDAWTVDTSYPTSALMRRYGLTANTHLGRSSWSARLTQYLDMGEYNTGATDHSSASVNFSLSIHTTKSAGSNNGYLYIRYNTGSYTSGPATIRLSGIFLKLSTFRLKVVILYFLQTFINSSLFL